MKKVSIIILVLFSLFFIPLWAYADMVEGSVQGFTCVTQGKICPVGKEDPMAAVENVFVILTKGGDYYFVPNLDRSVLARHINDQVRVIGRISPKYPSIIADKIEVLNKGAWRSAWRYNWQRKFYVELYGGVDLP